MPHPSDEQLNAFARGIAEGRNIRQAAMDAGYSHTTSSFYRWPKKPEFKARIEKFRRALAPAETCDLLPIIERMIAAADAAVVIASGAGMHAVCELLSAAAKLKQLLPPSGDGEEATYEISREEWLARCPPKDAA